jgi:two-component system, cell cycle response regulator
MLPAIPSCASLPGACGKPSEAYDSVGRYGGEEFLIVLPGCDGASALAHAERVRASFADSLFLTIQGRVTVTCSIGVSSRAHPREVDAEVLLREADLALYGAKGDGRNRVVVPVLL